jgi:hypothetical protein
MVTPKNMNVAGQKTLKDMIELEMYLMSQSQATPWPMLRRGTRKRCGVKEPYPALVESSVARELLNLGFIEGTSRTTFVVSKSGYQFYEREMKPDSARSIYSKD